MRVLIAGAEAASHHMLHVRLIAREALRRGRRVVLATTEESLRHPAGKAVVEEFSGALEVVRMPKVGPDRPGHEPLVELADQREQLACFQKAVDEVRPDAVYLVDLDSVCRASAEARRPFAGIPWSGMLIRFTFHRAAMKISCGGDVSDWEEAVLKSLLAQEDLRAVATIDESLAGYARTHLPSVGEKLRWVPDTCDMEAVPDRAEARRALGIPEGLNLLLVHGELTARKNVGMAIEAVATCDALRETGVLLSGKQDADVRRQLSSPHADHLRAQRRLWEVDRFLVGSEQEACFAAADAVWVCYRDFFGMSAVLVQAGRAERPVVACRDGLIGWLANRHELGPVVESSIRDAVQNALVQVMHDSEARARYAANGAAMAKRHAEPGFGTWICHLLSGSGVQEGPPDGR
jgi:glycosyltransferase involved in cell wall biosynthesis